MRKIINRQKGPTQLIIRSRDHVGDFTTLNIPGMGAGKNVIFLEDELITEYVEQAEERGLISTEVVENVIEGE